MLQRPSTADWGWLRESRTRFGALFLAAETHVLSVAELRFLKPLVETLGDPWKSSARRLEGSPMCSHETSLCALMRPGDHVLL